ncbi:NUDIX hydrolase [Arenibaculum pallidiluteum]|uniref:NUDIX hydrolase n=1 Tax=Arenibaculum pallidiluteum TaxID=2812559 RepID=UPI001A95F2C4|nr:NUDIX hydrolase [Arenibaculum pallidiluteum]
MNPHRDRRQYAALPYRLVKGHPEVLLITSRRAGRWIIPKGGAEEGVEPHDLAAREAYEEAGVRGEVAPQPIGSYRDVKRLRSGRSVDLDVTVFLLNVTEELQSWPEQDQRRRRWLSPGRAALLVRKRKLAALMLRLWLRPRSGGHAGAVNHPA